MSRRILLVANTLPPRDLSGVGEQVLQLAAGLRQRGHEVRILGRGPGGARGPKVLFPLTVVPALVYALLRWRPDVIQVHESDGGLGALALRLLGWRRRRPRLVALQQVSYRREIEAVRPLRAADGRILGEPGAAERRFRRFKGPLQVLLGRLSARCADLVLAPSRVTAEELRQDYGVSAVEVLPNVTGALTVTAAPRPAPEEAAGYFLFVGRLRIRKGVEVLFEALLQQPDLRGRLLLAGDGEHGPALREKARSLGSEGRIRFLGRCGGGQVRALLKDARALVVPSTYEGMPLVILEAMEQGVPVIASAVSGIPEVVIAGETGWLVPAEDVEALAAALEEAAASPQEAAARGAAGRQRLDRLFRPPRAARLWEDLVLEQRSAAREQEEGKSEP